MAGGSCCSVGFFVDNASHFVEPSHLLESLPSEMLPPGTDRSTVGVRCCAVSVNSAAKSRACLATRYEKMAFHVVNSENSNEAVGVLAARLLLWQYVTEYVVAASVGATCVIVVLVVASSDHCMGIESILRRYSKVSFFVCVAEEAINVGPLFALGQKFSPGRVSFHAMQEAPPVIAVVECEAPPKNDLPVVAYLPRIIRNLQAAPSRVCLIEGATGCGKSTQVPIAILNSDPGSVVWCTQPRRMAAMALATRINQERFPHCDAAFTVGGKSSEHEGARLIFMTPGVLLLRVKHAFSKASFLNDTRVTHIILDEVHERTIEYDLLCCMLRTLLKFNLKLRVLLMSATMATAQLREYLYRGCAKPSTTEQGSNSSCDSSDSEESAESSMWPCNAKLSPLTLEDHHMMHLVVPLVRMTQSVFPRTIRYINDMFDAVKQGTEGPLPFALGEILQNTQKPQALLWPARYELLLRHIMWIHTTRPRSESVLIFVSGMSMIERISTSLHEKDATSAEMRIIILHSSNDLDEQAEELLAPSQGKRRVIVATNIAESSVTIPDVDHVVDTCLEKEMHYSCECKLGVIEESFCSQDSCEQRAGRTARVRPGTVWRLCTREEYAALPTTRVCEILRTNVASAILLVADCRLGSIFRFLVALPCPPPEDNIVDALHDLTEHYCAVTQSAHLSVTPTRKGMLMASLGLELPVAQFLLLGAAFDILMPCVQAAAVMVARNSFVRDSAAAALSMVDHGTSSDFVANVEAYRLWLRSFRSTKASHNWLPHEKQILDSMKPATCREIRDTTADILSHLASVGLTQDATHPPNALWEGEKDVCPLSDCDALLLVVVATCGFIRNTIHAFPVEEYGSAVKTSTGHRITRFRKSAKTFVPSSTLHITHLLPSTARDLEVLQEYVQENFAASCVVSKRTTTESIVEFQCDTFPIAEHSAMLVRNIYRPAYQLLKLGRQACQTLNVKYIEPNDDVHTLSTAFRELKCLLRLDSKCLASPLVEDARFPLPPTLVACAMARQTHCATVLSAAFLPGSLSSFSFPAALIVHWDGASLCNGWPLLPSLPLCRASQDRINSKSGGALLDITSLHNDLVSFLDQQRPSTGCSESQRCGLLDEVRARAASLRQKLLTVLFPYLDELPVEYCPIGAREAQEIAARSETSSVLYLSPRTRRRALNRSEPPRQVSGSNDVLCCVSEEDAVREQKKAQLKGPTTLLSRLAEGDGVLPKPLSTPAFIQPVVRDALLRTGSSRFCVAEWFADRTEEVALAASFLHGDDGCFTVRTATFLTRTFAGKLRMQQRLAQLPPSSCVQRKVQQKDPLRFIWSFHSPSDGGLVAERTRKEMNVLFITFDALGTEVHRPFLKQMAAKREGLRSSAAVVVIVCGMECDELGGVPLYRSDNNMAVLWA